MRSSFARTVLWAMLSAASMAAVAALNLEDFDSDAMRAMDDAYKDLEPVLGASNAAAAKENLATLQEVYGWTLEYFTAQEKEGKDGIAILNAGRKLLGEIEGAVNKRDFNAATLKARELQANCKACHDRFKPKKQ